MAYRYLLPERVEISRDRLTESRQAVFDDEARKNEAKQQLQVNQAAQREEWAKERVVRRELHAREDAERAQQIAQDKEQAKSVNGFYVPAEHHIVAVIRIAGLKAMAPRPRKILQLFNLRKLHSCSIFRVNKAILNMLKYVSPYVIYGYPSNEMVHKLLSSRGYLKINGQRIRATDDLVAEHFSKQQIISIEDAARELVRPGSDFKSIKRSLCEFRLNTPSGGFIRKKNAFTECRGGDSGNREELIDEILERMI